MGRNRKGFTIIEVLVTIAVLSIGLLGAASLNIINMQTRQAINYRTKAIFLAQDIIEKIRMNLDSFYSLNVYNQPTAAATANCSTTTGCTATEMGLNDLWEWQQQITAHLPSGGGYVCYSSNPVLNNNTSATVPTVNQYCTAPGTGIARQALVRIWWLNRNGAYEQLSLVFKP